MNNKQAKKLRRLTEKATGRNPIGTSYKLKRHNKTGVIIVDPASPKAYYKNLKREWREGLWR